ncbi:YEATS domain-containing protein 2-like [Panicum miliaceum]|uniref:YEATS domain-containing protein 2-like n=1 Tax=Panicum miliaceum TaxID=4540 RepID=A0A3L6QUQ7_PANMI|nr:YEATS domain-containing protein 2-like [Panicum miliaceum]
MVSVTSRSTNSAASSHPSDAIASPASSGSSSSHSAIAAPQPTPIAIVQQVNIRSHVPVLLDLADSNYSPWRCFFDSVLSKFGFEEHVTAPPPLAQRDADWCQADCCVTNWIYTTLTKAVFDIVHKPRASSFTIWTDIEGLFRDNELQRTVYLEAEFRTLQQGNLSMTEYCSRLKQLAGNLCDVGQPVSELSQVLNLLRGLNTKYRHVKPVITSKFPPHTFMSARSYLLLEEIQLQHDAKMEAGQAFLAGHGGSGTSSGSTDNSNNSRSKSKNKRRGHGYGSSSSGPSANPGNGGGGGPQQRPQLSAAPWSQGYNPWTGLVQAWPVPFRAPGAGLLGPRPPFSAQQAMTAHHQASLPAPPENSNHGAQGRDPSALYTALTAGVSMPPPSASEWYLDTGASTHMSFASGSSNPNGEAPM